MDMKIGLAIADPAEYAPLSAISGEDFSFYGRQGKTFRLNKNLTVSAVCFGIGKVNAAAAAARLIDGGCDILLNYGLSGGISGVRKNDIVLCSRYAEHDFDLTPLGYARGEKPSQKYIYNADERLLSIYKNLLPEAIIGPSVTGDRFICDKGEANFVFERFGALCCDMETAALAAVCDMTNTPFLAVRRISDGADENAPESYNNANSSDQSELVLKVLYGAEKIFESDKFIRR